MPFICAWRASPADMSDEARSKIVSAQMKKWGHTMAPADVRGAHEMLSMAFPFDIHLPVPSDALTAPDKECCVCHHPQSLKVYTHEATVKTFRVAGPPRAVTVHDKRCVSCKTWHGYACVSTRGAVALLHVDYPLKPPAVVLAVMSDLKKLGLPCELVSRDRVNGLTLVRGFDLEPLHYWTNQRSDADQPSAHHREHVMNQIGIEVAKMKARVPTGDLSARIHRYRTGVLELPVFMPSAKWGGGQKAYDRDLLILVSATMERTQARSAWHRSLSCVVSPSPRDPLRMWSRRFRSGAYAMRSRSAMSRRTGRPAWSTR